MGCVITAIALMLVLFSTSPTVCVSQIDTSSTRTHVPGQITTPYSPAQDSLYKAALSVMTTGRARFQFDTREFSDAMRAAAELAPKTSNWENMRRNMAIPPELLAPSPQEIAQHRLNIANSQYVPGVLMWPMGTGNLQVNMGDIARLFGLAEDVSPNIAYVVDETSDVTIVVYSASAILIRTLFRGVQSPGAYNLDWDGRNDAGKMIGNGDYVAEVQLGKTRIMRKHIVWPPQ